MNAPTLFVFFPFVFGAFELLFAEKRKIVAFASLIVCIALIAWASMIPINSMIIYGENSLIYISSIDVMGRTLALERSQQTVLAFFYGVAAVGILLSLVVSSSRFFVPAVLMLSALIIAVIAVKPFIFGAMMIFLAVLIVFPLLWYEKRGDGSGILRFVFWQLMGTIFLSLGAWLATLVDINPTNQALLLRVTLILFWGLVFWLGFFPIHSWLGMVMNESCPFISGFLVSLIQFAALYILLNFINSFIWIRTSTLFFTGLRNLGLAMLILGGIQTLTERTLQRIQSSLYISENGIAMILLGMRTSETFTIFLSLIFIRVISGIFFSTAVKSLMCDFSTDIVAEEINPAQRAMSVLMIILAYFSIAGFPFLASFALKISFLSNAFAASGMTGALASFGSFLVFLGGFRMSFFLIRGSFKRPPTETDGEEAPESEVNRESKGLRTAMVCGCVFLLSIILYPELLNAFISGLYYHFSLIIGG